MFFLSGRGILDNMGNSGKRTGGMLTVLLALVIALTAELIKFSGPQFDFVLNNAGVIVVALVAVGVYAIPCVFTAIFLNRKLPSGLSMFAAVGAMVLGRVTMQWLSGTPLLVVGMLTVALSVSTAVIVSAVASRFGGIIIARGVGAGLFLSAGLSLMLGTLDSIWHSSVTGILPAYLIAAGALAIAWMLRTMPGREYSRGVWALGPVLSMGVMVFANPAFIASQADVSLWVSAVSLLLGFLLATILLSSRTQPTYLLAVVAVLATATIFFTPSWPAPNSALVSIIVVVFVGLLAAAFLGLLAVITERSTPRSSAARLSGVSAGAGLLVILPVLIYQIDYDIPLGFPNELIIVALALLVGAHALWAARFERFAGISTSVLDDQAASPFARITLVGSLVAVSALTLIGAYNVAPKAQAVPALSVLNPTIMNWNIHYGISLDGAITVEDMAQVIADSGAHVVALQEVSRGWVMGGGGDQLTYLANKLGMDYAFVGAADKQFGNAIMWSPLVSVTDIARTNLDYGDGPQNRSAIAGTLNLNGAEITIANAHLQHRDVNTPTRMQQIADMFEGLTIGENAVVTGDFNAEPGWPEILHFESEGFTSAVDTTGDPNSLTYPANSPEVRIDWMFGRGVEFGPTTVVQTNESDHLPIVSSISLQ